MSEAIVVDYELPHPPEKVWRALTEPALLSAWLMQNDIAPVVGHQFRFQSKPMGSWDGLVYCEVLEADAPRRLSYKWQGGKDSSSGAGTHLDTVVTWTLTPRGDAGTLLRLEHKGFLPKDVFAYDNMGKGWRGHLAERLASLVATL